MKLHYKVYGSGRPILILHGLFGMLDNWQTFARHLADAYQVFTLDLRNHGRSPHHDTFDYPTLAGDILEFIHSHRLQEVSLIGHSLGGKVAMQTVLSDAESIDRLIVIDIAPRVYPSDHDNIVDALLSIDPSAAKSRSQIEDTLMERLQDVGVVRFLMKNLARQDDGTLFWRMNLRVLASGYHYTTTAITSDKPYTGPTLFVRGGRSNYIRDEDWPDILDLFPAARLKTVEHAGHWVHADAMAELLDITRAFFQMPA